jgi:hypothetical protein
VRFDDDETPPPTLFDPSRADDPRAREWANRECEYVQEIAQLKAQLAEAQAKAATAILERAQLALELNNVRRSLHPAGKKEVKR